MIIQFCFRKVSGLCFYKLCGGAMVQSILLYGLSIIRVHGSFGIVIIFGKMWQKKGIPDLTLFQLLEW